ncbi:MAG: AAA family ATPase, partial [Acidimicrobiales bacterium]|nr:AAA family ATPase [Acidimicrobiales bacterium]
QFTPDLLPADLTGTEIFRPQEGSFAFQQGPLFHNLLLADEINRAPAKVQSALLEAMGERQVTVDGVTYPMAPPFMVIATQNPIEHEGTYPLPESQLDRFLMRLSVGYPSRDAEIDVLEAHGDTNPLTALDSVAGPDDIAALAAAARSVHVAPALREYLVDLADASRRHPQLALGMSPRASLGLQRVARARAAAAGREFVVPDDLKALAHPVLDHRLLLTPEAQIQGYRSADAVDDLLRTVPLPTGRG